MEGLGDEWQWGEIPKESIRNYRNRIRVRRVDSLVLFCFLVPHRSAVCMVTFITTATNLTREGLEGI